MFENRSQFRMGSFDSPRLPAVTPPAAAPVVEVQGASPAAPSAQAVPQAQIDDSMVGRTLKPSGLDKAEAEIADRDTVVVGGFVVKRVGQELLVSGLLSEPDALRLPSYSTTLEAGDRKLAILLTPVSDIPNLAAPDADKAPEAVKAPDKEGDDGAA